MKKIFTAALCFAISSSVFSISEMTVQEDLSEKGIPGFRIVSDFDDTIKRSHIPNMGIRTFGRAFLFGKVFNGIPELYQVFNERHNGVYVLSASPNIVNPIIKSSLKYFDIPYEEVFTRSLSEIGTNAKKIEYKKSRILGVIEGNEDKLILLGDDVEADHQIYKMIETEAPGRVAQIYIRRVKNIELPNDVVGFYSSFEIAANEYFKGRMALEDVTEIANIILDTPSDEMRRIIPYYSYCPTKPEEFSPVKNPELYELELLVQIKITEHCLGPKID